MPHNLNYLHIHIKLLHKSRKDFVGVDHAQPTIFLEDLVDEGKGCNHDIWYQNSPLNDNFPFADLFLGSKNFHSCPLGESALGVVVNNNRHFPEEKKNYTEKYPKTLNIQNTC